MTRSIRFWEIVLAYGLIPLLSLAIFWPAQADAQDTKETKKERDKFQRGEEDPPLPKLKEMQIPTPDELLKGKPIDWIVFKNEDVLVVELVSPRPNTLAKMSEQYQKLYFDFEKRRNPAEKEQIQKELDNQRRLLVTIIDGGDEPDFYIETKVIDKIIYYEDLILQRTGKLIEEGNTGLAYDMLLFLSQRARGWPKAVDYQNLLLFREAELFHAKGDVFPAFQYLEELWDRKYENPKLIERHSQYTDEILEALNKEADYRQARHFLGRFAARVPDHPIVTKWRRQFQSLTVAKMNEAKELASKGDAAGASDLIWHAARIDPSTPRLKETEKELQQNYQILNVGVFRLPQAKSSYPFQTMDDERERQLQELAFFEPRSITEAGMRYQSPLFEAWEPSDLGREVRFFLQRNPNEGEARQMVTSVGVTEVLKSRLNPQSPSYDERLASMVSSVSIESPWEFTVRFRTVPIRLENIMAFPLSTLNSFSESDDAEEIALRERSNVKFVAINRDEDQTSYQRSRLEAANTKQKHLTEIREKRFPAWRPLLMSMMRGEIDACPSAELRDVPQLQEDGRFFVVPYALPQSHVVVYHPESKIFKSITLRRALLYGIPRKHILETVVLGNAEKSFGRLTTSPIAQSSNAYNQILPQAEYNAPLAASLALAAAKELKEDVPVLKLACPPDARARMACAEMIKEWKRVGLKVELTDDNATDPPKWDMCYRIVRLNEPLTDVWPFLTLRPTAQMDSLEAFPTWIRRRLMDLDASSDWSAAVRAMQRFESDLLYDARWLPLWEIDEFFVARRHLNGVPAKLIHPYHDAQRWIVQPWYPTENP